MTIRLHYASGSPYAWRAWLGLEHKTLPYTLVTRTFSSGELRTSEYLALNPRGRVPVLEDDDFVLYESAAILEYLDDAYPASGLRLFPGDPRSRGTARRLIREADEYLAHALEGMVEEILFKPTEAWDAGNIARARDAFNRELVHFDGQLRGDFFCGAPGAVDLTLYPLIALALRMQLKKPDLGIRPAIGATLDAWMRRVEALPHVERTWPPHWRAA